jgi:tetratricopeptide (TPR) repeat protein
MLRVADKALYYDHESISGYYLRGIYYKSLGDTKQAKEEFEKAIRIDPNVSQPYRLLGYCQDNMIKSLECMGKEALLDHSIGRANSLRNLGDQYFAAGFPKLGNAFYLDALKLDGDTALYSADLVRVSAWCYGEYKKALEYYQKSYLKDTTDASTILCLGYYNATAGRYKESLKFYNKYLAGKESYENCKLSRTQRKLMEYLLIYVYIQNGDRREADHLADKVIDINNSYIRSYPYLVDHYTLACIYASRGENAKAYENLRICNQNGIYYLSRVIILRNDPFFSNIRNEPEFQKIVKNLEAKYQAEHERVRKWLEEKENSGYIIR